MRILKKHYDAARLLEMAIWDNRTHRDLHPMEQSRAIDKLTALGHEVSFEGLVTLLGLPASKKVFEKVKGLCKLPQPVQAGLAADALSFEAAVDLSRLSRTDAEALFSLLRVLRLSQNKQQEIILLVQEVALREDISLDAVVNAPEVEAILNNPDRNQNEKGTALRRYLRRRRYPTLSEAEQRFGEHVKRLKLPSGLRITPPADFEGPSYVLHLSFTSLEELDEKQKELARLMRHPAMEDILARAETPGRREKKE